MRCRVKQDTVVRGLWTVGATEMLLGSCDLSGSLKQAGTLNPAVGQVYAGGEPKLCFCTRSVKTVFVWCMLNKSHFVCLILKK